MAQDMFLPVDTFEYCPPELPHAAYAVRALGATAANEVSRVDFQIGTDRELNDVVLEADQRLGSPIGVLSLIRACGLHPGFGAIRFELVHSLILQHKGGAPQRIARHRNYKPRIYTDGKGVGTAVVEGEETGRYPVAFAPYDVAHPPRLLYEARARRGLHLAVAATGLETVVRSQRDLKRLSSQGAIKS